MPAIILAAGLSKRMGFPKAFLPIGQRTLLEDQMARLKKAGCRPIIIVAPPSPSQFSSVKCGLKALPSHSRGCLILPIDVPFVPVATFKKVIASALDCFVRRKRPRNDMPDAVIPTYQHTKTLKYQKGHPVWISGYLIKKILKTPARSGRLDTILKGVRPLYIATTSRAILNNINTPSSRIKR